MDFMIGSSDLSKFGTADLDEANEANEANTHEKAVLKRVNTGRRLKLLSSTKFAKTFFWVCWK
jgi:hypothetical protein